jgi:uncharacterized protein YggT (Ycf19 family)
MSVPSGPGAPADPRDPYGAADPYAPYAPGDQVRPGGGSQPGLGILRVARVLVAFVYVVVTACLVVLFLGFVLQLFGASTDAEFTRWVYRNVERIMEPFRGMFPSPTLSDRSVLDVSLLFAMIVYALAALGLHALVSWLAGRIAAANRPRQRYGPASWSRTGGRAPG